VNNTGNKKGSITK